MYMSVPTFRHQVPVRLVNAMQTSMHARLAPCLFRRRRRFKIWRTTLSLIFTLRTQNCLIRSSQPALYLPLNLIMTPILNNDEAGSGTAPHPQTTSQASHHGPGPMSMWSLIYIYIYVTYAYIALSV